MCNDKVANRFGRSFHRRKERFDLEHLQPGDHIVEEGYCTYWHHMIVEKVDINQKQIHVIHYNEKKGPSGSGSSVCQSYKEYTPDKIYYRIVYEDKECFEPSEVLNKARARIGEKKYCPVRNNCEHFANECKTGKKECHQIWTAIEIGLKSLTSTVVSYLKKLKESDIKKVVEFGAKCDNTVGILVAAILEMILLYWDYSDTKAKFNKEKLTHKEADEVIVTRVCAAVCSIPGHGIGSYLGHRIGSYLGHIIGSYLRGIGWFTLGTYFGGWVLPILGTFVVGAACDYLVKEIAGAYLGELLTPLFTSIELYIKEKSQ